MLTRTLGTVAADTAEITSVVGIAVAMSVAGIVVVMSAVRTAEDMPVADTAGAARSDMLTEVLRMNCNVQTYGH